jgi:SAM-dependent methyltransferase
VIDPPRERMYDDLADCWTLISAVDEYVEEADLFRRVLLAHTPEPPRTLLELGSGGGNNAFHLKTHFRMTLVDRSDGMLRQSRRINPELRHYLGDMRDVRLDETFDAVFIHDAISYMTSRDDLLRAMRTAFVHCRPGGIALFAPDETLERFEPSTECGGTDRDGRGVRYLEWSHDPDASDECTTTDYVFLIREADGATRVVHDRHVNGLFPRQVWLDTIRAAGFEPRSGVYPHSDLPEGYELFVGLRER